MTRSQANPLLRLPILAATLVATTLVVIAPALADDATLLAAHNANRAKHCVPALSWSADLAKGAQDWASACVFEHSSGDYGENLFMGSGQTDNSAVDGWYSEIGNYDFDNPAYKSGVGHFTQMIWKDSTTLGCGVATCGDQTMWVCRYSPPGNFNVDNPGVLADQVPRTCQ